MRENSNPNERLAFTNLCYLPRENVGGLIPPLRTNSLACRRKVLETPFSIDGSCDVWNTVEIRKPNNPALASLILSAGRERGAT